jgi:UDP:flavonoid glycosyltransferase YjiC (YdhE family)
MRIVLTTWGSFGDLHPTLALGVGLAARGHTVTIATCGVYAQKVRREGLRFAPLRPDLPDDALTPQLAARVMDRRRGTKAVVAELIMPHLRAMVTDLEDACTGADLLVNHSVVFAGPIVAALRGQPFLSVALQPIVFASATDPSVPPSQPGWTELKRLGPTINRALLCAGKHAIRPWTAPVNVLRRTLGLPDVRNPLFEDQFSAHGTLALFSSVLAQPQPDWPARTTICGFPFYDRLFGGEEPGLDPALARFLENGTPPLVFTLGSSAVMTAGRFWQESIAAARHLNRRAVLLVGREPDAIARLGPLPESIIAVAYAPHSSLMPRGAATIHQGGIGTTGQALRAGVPQVVVPFAHDQPDNAARVARLGVGTTIPRSQYRMGRIVDALSGLLNAPVTVAKAHSIAERVRAENGVAAACDRIESGM